MTHLPETRAGSSWNPAPQRRFLARVATKFVLVSSASFQRENMADDEDAAAAACAIVAILAYSHNRKKRADQQKWPITVLHLRRIPA